VPTAAAADAGLSGRRCDRGEPAITDAFNRYTSAFVIARPPRSQPRDARLAAASVRSVALCEIVARAVSVGAANQ